MNTNKDSKKEIKEICLLYVGDNKENDMEMAEFIEKINGAITEKNGFVRIVMDVASDIPGYEEMHLKTDFEKYDILISFLEEFCTVPQEQIIRNYIQYRNIKKIEREKHMCRHRCNGHFFQYKVMASDEMDQSIKEVCDLLKESNAYIISCLTLDTVKLGALIAINQAFRRKGYVGNMKMRDGEIFLNNTIVLSTENIPEILVNNKIVRIKNEIRMLEENENIEIKDKADKIRLLHKNLNRVEDKLLLYLKMLYDFMTKWDYETTELAKNLYEKVAEGIPAGWK